MLQVAICDDDNRMRIQLGKLLAGFVEAEAEQFENGEALLASERKFDLILLDIRMDEEGGSTAMNGIETAKEIRKRSRAVIIFITALREYVFDAYDVEAFHYLLKPIDVKKFHEVLGRAVAQIEKYKNAGSLVIKAKGICQSIPANEILYAESCGRKIILHTKTEEITFYGKMEDLEQKLGSSFFRSHRGYLVNLESVEAYGKTDIMLKNKETVYLSKQRYHQFVTSYMDYLTNQDGN